MADETPSNASASDLRPAQPSHEGNSVTDATSFLELADSLSIRGRLGNNASAVTISFVVSTAVFALGATLAVISGSLRVFAGSHAIYIFTLDLFISIWTILWLDDVIGLTITDMAEAFATDAATYYEFMSDFLNQLYDPIPTRTDLLHLPTIVSVILGVVVFYVIPVFEAPTLLSQALGVNWGSSPLLFQLYIFILVTTAVIVGVGVSWVVCVIAWHMGFKARELEISLDITRINDNLGLTPYSHVIFISFCAYLLVYVVTTTIFVFIQLNEVILVGLGIMSLLPLIGFVGSQYGLHVAIRRSKKRRLRELRSEFDHEVQLWFMNDGPLPSDAEDSDIVDFIAAKEALESLPEWPIQMRSVTQLISATLASNIWVIFQIAGIIG